MVYFKLAYWSLGTSNSHSTTSAEKLFLNCFIFIWHFCFSLLSVVFDIYFPSNTNHSILPDFILFFCLASHLLLVRTVHNVQDVNLHSVIMLLLFVFNFFLIVSNIYIYVCMFCFLFFFFLFDCQLVWDIRFLTHKIFSLLLMHPMLNPSSIWPFFFFNVDCQIMWNFVILLFIHFPDPFILPWKKKKTRKDLTLMNSTTSVCQWWKLAPCFLHFS